VSRKLCGVLFPGPEKNSYNSLKFRYKITTTLLDKKPLCIGRKDALKKPD
jgi:hypothetical protein